jgi:dihydrodipicolinate synthase/N-acetylneuraminate lyase
MLKGAIAAAVTPLRDQGRSIDEASVGPLVRFLADGGVDGLLACGTTGEGVLLSADERRAVTEAFLAHRPAGFLVAVHAGAQTTDDTVAIASHARDAGADAVAVIAPPYYPLDETELLEHLFAAAAASAPLPFYVYEFTGRSGYAIPVAVIERLREVASNLAGLKVSDVPWANVEPYLLEGLDVFIGSEPLVLRGFGSGAVGAVSGLATAFPEIVSSLVHDRDDRAGERVATLRERLTMPFIPALKELLVARGILGASDVRRPLRRLDDGEREAAFEAARAVGVDVVAGQRLS